MSRATPPTLLLAPALAAATGWWSGDAASGSGSGDAGSGSGSGDFAAPSGCTGASFGSNLGAGLPAGSRDGT